MTVPRRGATLSELTVAMSCALLLLSGAYALLVPGLRAWARTNERTHLRQQASTVLARLAHDLRMTCVDSLVLQNGEFDHESSDGMSFVSPYDDDGAISVKDDGSIDWRCYEVVYHDPSARAVMVGSRPLLRQPDGDVVMRLPSFTPDPARDRPVARDIAGLHIDSPLQPQDDTFELEPQTSPTRRNPVRLEVHARDLHEDCRLHTATSSLLPGFLPRGVPGQ